MKIPVGSITVDMVEAGCRACWHESQTGFERDTLAVWGKLCAAAPTRLAIDVGAYTGIYAVSAAMHGMTVHAFEPLDRNADRTRENAKANGVGGLVWVHPHVVSNRNGVAVLNFNGRMKEMTSGASIISTKHGYERQEVTSRTLDSYEFEDVATIKIDVERAEPLVLEGAAKTLEKWKPTLIVEALDDNQRDAVCAAVKGYRVADVLDKRNLLMVPC